MRKILTATMCAALLAGASPAVALPPTPAPSPVVAVANKVTGPLIYIMRGGADIFSTGMNVLADELTDAGIPSESLNFSHWRELVDKVRENYQTGKVPIIVIGHSWGANSALLMAQKLRETSTPVALLVLYDATADLVIPPNVNWVLNFRSQAAIGLDVQVTGGYGFHGKIETIDARNLDHIQVDKDEHLHQRTIDAIQKVMGPGAAKKAVGAG
jgi:pimeloyl-ACP methyl ester carboxylesterase